VGVLVLVGAAEPVAFRQQTASGIVLELFDRAVFIGGFRHPAGIVVFVLSGAGAAFVIVAQRGDAAGAIVLVAQGVPFRTGDASQPGTVMLVLPLRAGRVPVFEEAAVIVVSQRRCGVAAAGGNPHPALVVEG